jgi:hypothetical protein
MKQHFFDKVHLTNRRTIITKMILNDLDDNLQ